MTGVRLLQVSDEGTASASGDGRMGWLSCGGMYHVSVRCVYTVEHGLGVGAGLVVDGCGRHVLRIEVAVGGLSRVRQTGGEDGGVGGVAVEEACCCCCFLVITTTLSGCPTF